MIKDILICTQNDETSLQYKNRISQENTREEIWTRGIQMNISNATKNLDEFKILLEEMGGGQDFIALS